MSDWLPIAKIAEKVKSGELKSEKLVRKSLAKIEECKDYDAIISACQERALAQAEEIDKNPKLGEEERKKLKIFFNLKNDVFLL